MDIYSGHMTRHSRKPVDQHSDPAPASHIAMVPDHDLHVHTYLSACCGDKERQRPAAILALAERMRLRTIGFSDHVWAHPTNAPNDWYRPQDECQIARLRADLAPLTSPVRVLVGCETDMSAPGIFGLTQAFAEQLDFVLLSCNHFHIRDFVAQPRSNAPRDLADHILAFFHSAVASGLPTAIAHPFITLGYIEQYDATLAAMSDAEMLDALGAAAAHDVAIEITTAFIPKPHAPQFSIETPLRFLALAKQAGCRFTLATDAHAPTAQQRLPELSVFIETLGLTREDFAPICQAS